MGKGNCAVVSCTNSTYRLNKWKSEHCSIHGKIHKECECQPPFRLHFFPSELRNSRARERWIKAMKREGQNKTKWTPTASDRVCSDHFVDDGPTDENPDPTVNLGYEVSNKRPRRTLFRQPAQPKRKKTVQSVDFQSPSSSTTSTTAAELPQETDLLSPTSSECSFLSDHTYLATPAKQACGKCIDQGEVIKSLVSKVNKLTLTIRKQKFITTKSSQFTWRNIKNDKKMNFYTGFCTIAIFNAVFLLLQPYLPKVRYWRGPKRNKSKVRQRRFQPMKNKILSHRDEFLLTLMRLRLGLLNEDLADRFGVSPTICSNTFTTWIRIISVILGKALVNWLPREPIRENLPECFKKMNYHKCRTILDCTEVFIERPKSLLAQALTWSDYKHHNTFKFLVGIAPSGFITFLSHSYGGRASDNAIVKESGFYDLLERDDHIMADRGFQIREDLLLRFCTLIIPPGKRGKSQFTQQEVELTKKVANVRIHVERAINRLKTYRIVKSVFPISMLHHADDIVLSCAALCNLKNLLIR